MSDNQLSGREPETWKRDLVAAGWVAESVIKWRSPDGGLWRGPYGAWRELQRRNEQREPAEVFHVMDFIDDELEVRGWNLDMLALRMGGNPSHNLLVLQLTELREPGVLMAEETAFQIGRAFGTSKHLWLNLDATWQRFNPAPATGEVAKQDQK